uniref:AT3G52170-like helix-turn-helix domain-containing protein n=1 Tax=Opuntia streptacantha TaxID=393608 RepID=A0A7C8Z4T2_OPUST
MYAIKASWVGQTFALATTNDSGGRKSRIRRSKEERKAMIESFIKRYQIINDGNFPSLNLTHKEVGGSFYTVREIVREIIQENKVLGPARFSGKAQKGHIVTEDYSSESSSSQAQILLSVNKLDGVSKYHKNDSVGLTSDANGHCTNHQDLDSLQCSTEKRADDMSEVSDESAGISVNENDRQYESLEPSLNNVAHCLNDNQIGDAQFVISTQTNGVSKESDEIGEGSLVTETSQGDKQKELVGACNAELTVPTIELEVETFPLRPAIKEIDGVSSTSTGLVDINGTLNNLGTKHNEISNGVPQFDKFASPDSLSAMVTAKGAGGSEHSTTVPGIVKQMAEIKNQVIQGEQADCTNKTLEMLPSSAVRDQSIPFDEGCVYKVASHSGSASNTMDQSEEIDELQCWALLVFLVLKWDGFKASHMVSLLLWDCHWETCHFMYHHTEVPTSDFLNLNLKYKI